MRAIAKLLKRLFPHINGNATLLVGLGMPVLIGGAGYATDMAQVYVWKRELQHSVDQAAMAGAWALAYDKNTNTYATRAMQEYAANQVYTKNFDATPNIQLGSYGSGGNNSVIVSSSVTLKLPFSSYLTNKALTISASAQATFAQGGNYQACLMALKKGQGSTFTVGGSAVVNASCGLGALSCAEDAIKIDVDDKDPTKKGVTTDSIVTCGTADVPEYLKGKLTENEPGVSNPFEDLPPPTPPSESAKSFNCPKDGTYNISPGRYTGGFNVTCKVVMEKGIYVVDGGTLDLTSNKGDITGTGVMFVLRNGANLKLGGSGTGGKVNLSPMEAGAFVDTVNEAYKDLYAGMLVYEDDSNQTDPVAHHLNGNADVEIRGTIYLPNGDLTVNGNSNTTPLCFQLWASTLKITGNTSISTTCTKSQTNSAGSTNGGVRLVA